MGCGMLEQRIWIPREEAAADPLLVLGGELPAPDRGESLLLVGCR